MTLTSEVLRAFVDDIMVGGERTGVPGSAKHSSLLASMLTEVTLHECDATQL